MVHMKSRKPASLPVLFWVVGGGLGLGGDRLWYVLTCYTTTGKVRNKSCFLVCTRGDGRVCLFLYPPIDVLIAFLGFDYY